MNIKFGTWVTISRSDRTDGWQVTWESKGTATIREASLFLMQLQQAINEAVRRNNYATDETPTETTTV